MEGYQEKMATLRRAALHYSRHPVKVSRSFGVGSIHKFAIKAQSLLLIRYFSGHINGDIQSNILLIQPKS